MSFTSSLSLKRVAIELVTVSLIAASCAESEFKGGAAGKALTSDDANPQLPRGTAVPTSESTLPVAVGGQPASLLSSFEASTVKEDSFNFTINPQSISTDFKLVDINKTVTEKATQVSRTQASQAFRQGAPANETQSQTTAKPVDILVVIDNSSSMSNEQTNFGSKMGALLVSLTNTDWQIGVITTSAMQKAGTAGTDLRDFSCVLKLIKSTDGDASAKFQAAINAGTNGASSERGVLQSVVGISCPEAPWVRSSATLAVLIVSDEDNCSKDGLNCGTSPWAKETFLIDYIEKTMGRTIGVNAGIYGIFDPTVDPAVPLCSTAGNIGTQYRRLVTYKAAGAVNYGNICDSSYSATLNRISANIATLLGKSFQLADTPLAGTLTVKLKLSNGTEQAVPAVDYTLSGKVITFNAGKEPPSGSQLLASYQVAAAPLVKEFMLGNEPAPGTVAVKVNGTLLGAGAYTVAGSKVTLVDLPPALADIMIDYRLNMPLQTRFKLTQQALDGSLTVMVNGVATKAYTYDKASQELVFTNPPIDNAEIATSFAYREGPQLAYPLPINAGASDFELLDGTNPLVFNLLNGIVTIKATDHVPGKVLRLQYRAPDGMPRTFALPHTAIENSGSIMITKGACEGTTGVEIQSTAVVSNCASTSPVDFVFKYKYRTAQGSFTMDGIDARAAGTWQVWVDGEPTLDYSREGATVTLNTEVDPASKVTIKYSFPE